MMKKADPDEFREEEARVRKLQRMASRVCSMILMADYEDIDVQIARGEVREECKMLFPDKMDLYDMIYEARFNRLWEQFRSKEMGPE